MRRSVLAVSAAASLALAMSVTPAAVASAPPEHAAPAATGSDIESMPIRGARSAPATSTSPITYHAGPVLKGTTNVYVIWYGNWTTVSTGKPILQNLLNSISGTSYYNINTTYYDSVGPVQNSVRLAGETSDNYSQGKKLSDKGVKAVVSQAIPTLGSDANALYFVLTSKDVAETSGFLTRYCGWHTHASIGGQDIKYSFVGDPTGPKLANCSAQSIGPNGNAGVDAMASVIAHELEETATDPDLNAWYDSSGYENADKCAWTFGTTSTAANGSQYNVTWGGLNYLVQQNWLASSPQGCAMSY